MTDSEAIGGLGDPLLQVLSEGWKKAFRDTRTGFYHPDHDAKYNSSTLQMRAVVHCKDTLVSQFGARYDIQQGQHIFTMVNQAHIVFNQLDEGLLRTRGKTNRSRQFFSQASLDGMDDLPRLICGAVPDAMWSMLLGVYLTHPHSRGRRNNWALNITSGVMSVDSDQFRIQLPESDTNTTSPRQNPYRRKDGERNKDEDSGEASAGALA